MNSPKETLRRHSIYDIIKGLAIIAIVIGHCAPNKDIVRFVYGFHLAIFYFVSGLQFNDSKYSQSPYLLLQSRIKSMWSSYFFYMTFFTLTSNLFIKIGILASDAAKDVDTTFSSIINNFFFIGFERLGGAMWFVPMLLVGVIFFGSIIYLSTEYIKRFRLFIITLLSLAAGALGLHYCEKGLKFSHYTQVALLLIPVMFLGYIISLYKIDLKKILRLPLAIITLIIFVYLTVIKDYHIELSASQIVSVYLFYPITICGIYTICYCAKILLKVKQIYKALEFIGKYSFDIMALHFLIFKIIDLLYGLITKAEPSAYLAFPHAYTHLWPIYILAGVIIPPFVRIGFRELSLLIKNFFHKQFSDNATAVKL